MQRMQKRVRNKQWHCKLYAKKIKYAAQKNCKNVNSCIILRMFVCKFVKTVALKVLRKAAIAVYQRQNLHIYRLTFVNIFVILHNVYLYAINNFFLLFFCFSLYMIYDDYTVKTFNKSSSFAFLTQPNTCAYDYTGEYICTAFTTHIQIHNALVPKLMTKIDIANNSVEFFTPKTVLYAKKNVLHYLSLYDATIMRKFAATSEIKHFSVSDNDLFMMFTSNVQIYDIKQSKPAYKINMNNGFGSFLDEKNLVVGNQSLIRFYDLRNTKGPTKILNTCNIESVKYNKYAQTIVLKNNIKRTHYFLDKHGYEKSKIVFDQKYQADITSDGKYYFASANNIIKVYDIAKKVNIHNYRDTETVGGCIALNPCYGQFVTCNTNMRF